MFYCILFTAMSKGPLKMTNIPLIYDFFFFRIFHISGQKAQISSQVSSLHTGIYLSMLSRYLVVRGY